MTLRVGPTGITADLPSHSINQRDDAGMMSAAEDLAFYFHVFTQIMSFFSLPVDDDKLLQSHMLPVE